MELLTQTPDGTDLHIETDRQFEGPVSDATIRIEGTRDGSAVYDGTFIMCDEHEAEMVGLLLRAIRQPTPELVEKVTQEVQATFSARLSGKDAHQAAEIMWTGLRQWVYDFVGGEGTYVGERVEELAERFERAAAKSRQAFAGTPQHGKTDGRRQSSAGATR